MEMNGQKYTPASHRGADPHEALSIGDAPILADKLPVGTRPVLAAAMVELSASNLTLVAPRRLNKPAFRANQNA